MAKKKKPAKAHAWTGKRIKALRLRLKLKQAPFAERLHISQGQLSNLEAGDRNASGPLAHLLDLIDAGTILAKYEAALDGCISLEYISVKY